MPDYDFYQQAFAGSVIPEGAFRENIARAEQWLVWLAVDLISFGLYIYKDIPLTAGLYALYSALAVAGYLRWRKAVEA